MGIIMKQFANYSRSVYLLECYELFYVSATMASHGVCLNYSAAWMKKKEDCGEPGMKVGGGGGGRGGGEGAGGERRGGRDNDNDNDKFYFRG
jgi:hypothetical protein